MLLSRTTNNSYTNRAGGVSYASETRVSFVTLLLSTIVIGLGLYVGFFATSVIAEYVTFKIILSS